MEEKIEYRWETKEEQELYWKEHDKWVEEEYESDMKRLLKYKDSKHRGDDFYYVINICEMTMKKYMRSNRIADAEHTAKIGKFILDQNKNEFFDIYNEFEWLLNGKENEELLNSALLQVEGYIAKGISYKSTYVDAALNALRLGDFQKAREHIANVYEVKPRSRLNESVIYHLERFYAFVCEYLCEPDKNKDILPKLTRCFRYLFDESQKGSKKLYDENHISLIQRGHIFGLRYIWYKYFSGRDWDTVSFIEIVQSERYGIKGLQDC